MASITFSLLRQRLSEMLDPFFLSGTNTATDSDGVTDVNIARRDSGRLIDKPVLITSGNRDGQWQRIASVASTKATVSPSFTGALANGDTFEILAEDPDLLEDAIHRAIRDSWPTKINGRGAPRGLFADVTDETLITDSLLANGSLDTFSTTFTSWANIGTPTLAAETAIKIHGSGSAKITATGATEGIEQNIINSLDILEAVGKTLRVRGWIHCDTAEAARFRVTQDGSTFTNGDWHDGQTHWEKFAFDHAITANPTELTVSCEVTDGNVGYFDLVRAYIDPIYEYTMPTSFYPNGPARVYYQAYEDRPEGLYLPLNGRRPWAGSVLRLEGAGRLSVPTTEAGTVEVDDSEAELILSLAAANLYRSLGKVSDAEYWAGRAADDRARYGHLLPAANERVGWRVSAESSRILYLER